ncbi:RES family NAD+ phosphorylase [Paraburkholderia sp. J8-2]|uniref:RES family NAD+ phosphorylase n=1 Tax=Paraburkholderia sp. J8-2 TaxID=2805440 RepID=UPI002AB6BF5B|nr:RES family NAD+ phosphorylase [Paraburkholderia sp. J8-2]
MSFVIPDPGPAESFVVETVTRADVPEWFHVYSTSPHANTALTFSEGWGDTRFAPITLPGGEPAHTWYAASRFDCAIMESVFHDLPLAPAGAFDVDKLEYFRIARVRFRGDLSCVSFHSAFLPQLGLTRTQLVDSLPTFYGQTRKWAQAAIEQRSDAQAIAYGSRRHDVGRCVMLIRQRLADPANPFELLDDQLLAAQPCRSKVLTLAASLGIATV